MERKKRKKLIQGHIEFTRHKLGVGGSKSELNVAEMLPISWLLLHTFPQGRLEFLTCL